MLDIRCNYSGQHEDILHYTVLSDRGGNVWTIPEYKNLFEKNIDEKITDVTVREEKTLVEDQVKKPKDSAEYGPWDPEFTVCGL